MEITKDINVNTDNLAEKSDIIIEYKGKLSTSGKVFINYGQTPNNLKYIQSELDQNNQIKIHLKNAGYFYFNFIDENGNIDNNDYKDYQLYIKQSNLVLTENSSMKELPSRYVVNNHNSSTLYKTFYTTQTIKNTSKPQEIIIPKNFSKDNATSQTKNVYGFILEPVKVETTYNLSQALIPTENFGLVDPMKNFKSSNCVGKVFKKIMYSIPSIFGKEQ